MTHTQSIQKYSLTTARILYRLPDFRNILQTYVWQEYDMYPTFPELREFLVFWEKNLEGPLHSVHIAHKKLISPSEFKITDGEFFLN